MYYSNIKRNLKSERKNTQAWTSLFIYAVSKYQYDSERGVHGPIETIDQNTVKKSDENGEAEITSINCQTPSYVFENNSVA